MFNLGYGFDRKNIFGSGESEFSPLDLSNLVFWADPSNSNYINPPSNPSNGDQVNLLSDRSLFSNNATQITSTKQPTWEDNRAIEFDGSNDNIDVFSIWNDLSSDSGLSFSMWVKPNQVGTGACLMSFWRPNTGSHQYNRLSFNQQGSGSLSFIMTNQDPSTTSNYILYNTLNPVFTVGTWKFLTVNYAADGTAPKFYVDAVEVTGNDLGSTDLTKGASDLNVMLGATIGSVNGAGGGERAYYDGQIGEVYLTKGSITEDKITELYDYSKGNY